MILVFIYLWIEISTEISNKFTNSPAFEVVVRHLKLDSSFTRAHGMLIDVDTSSIGGFYTPKKMLDLFLILKQLKRT